MRGISKKVFVRGFPDHIAREQVETFMSDYGKVLDVNLFESPTAKQSVSALITFENINSAFSAIDELQNRIIFGRRIYIEFAHTGPMARNNRGGGGTGYQSSTTTKATTVTETETADSNNI